MSKATEALDDLFWKTTVVFSDIYGKHGRKNYPGAVIFDANKKLRDNLKDLKSDEIRDVRDDWIRKYVV